MQPVLLFLDIGHPISMSCFLYLGSFIPQPSFPVSTMFPGQPVISAPEKNQQNKQKACCSAGHQVSTGLHDLGLHSRWPLSWTLLQEFLQLLDFCQSDMWETVSQDIIICISLIRSKAAHIFIWLRAICLSFFREQSVRFPSPFIYQVIVLFFSILRSSLYT